MSRMQSWVKDSPLVEVGATKGEEHKRSGRALQAISMAQEAARSANQRLEVARESRRTLLTIASGVGFVGIAALVAIGFAGFADPMFRALLLGGAAIVAVVPAAMAAKLAMADASEEESAAVAAEGARRVADEAKRLSEALADDAGVGMSPGSRSMANGLLDTIEHTAAAVKGRENRIRGVQADSRRHARIRPHRDRVIMKTKDQRSLTVKVLDVSLSGVGVEGNMPGVGVGDVVTIGRRRARAIRKLKNGIGFAFERELRPTELTADIVL